MWHTAVSRHITTFMYCKGEQAQQWSGTRLQEKRTLRNNRGNNSNFDIPCKELAYLTRTVIVISCPISEIVNALVNGARNEGQVRRS